MPRRGPVESETCREYVLPGLEDSGWQKDQIHPQYPITAGKVVFRGRRPEREEELRADYALEVAPGFPLAVLEAKRRYAKPADGLQQAKEYAELLDLPVALATNGKGIVEYDFHAGVERTLERFPRLDELWDRFQAWKGIADGTVAEILRQPFNRVLHNADGSAKEPRYYQRIAIHRAVVAILSGRRRVLLTMATGSGKRSLRCKWSGRFGDIGRRAASQARDEYCISLIATRSSSNSVQVNLRPPGKVRRKLDGTRST